jgi:Ca2+-transporting ATPase
VDPKSVEALQKMGGIDALLEALGTNPTKGLSATSLGTSEKEQTEKSKGASYEASLEDRKRVYGSNTVPTRKSKSLLLLMWLALKDKILVRLSLLSSLYDVLTVDGR